MAKFFEKLFSINFKEVDFSVEEIIAMIETALAELFGYVTGKLDA